MHDGPPYLNLLGWVDRFRLGWRVLLGCDPRGIVQRVVRIESGRFSEDFRNEICLGRLWGRGDRRLLEDFFEVSDLQGFADTRVLERTKRDFCQRDSQFGLHRQPRLEEARGA